MKINGSFICSVSLLYRTFVPILNKKHSVKRMKKTTISLSLCMLLLGGFGFAGCKKDHSMVMNDPHNVRGVISYKRSFPDINDTHLSAAKKLGISPLENREQSLSMRGSLEELESGDLYTVDSLTHSIPFLVPKAHTLLKTIGQNFLDSLQSKGLNPNKVLVTSVLRTREDVRRLRQRNGNASENSAHFYGTTFDLSYNRYVKVEHPDGRPMQDVSPDTLKLVLSEVLRDLRESEACYVKYELKQGCFHITARP